MVLLLHGYSNAYLGKTAIGDKEESIFDVDCITVNPYMGTDCVKPFIDDCKKYDKGIFVLVKTSNPSSGELQDLKLNNNKEVYAQVAELVEKWGEDLIGANGYSSVAAVVGATYPEQLSQIRKIAPHTYFLIPGYGAQGGKAEDVALYLNNGNGGVVNSSRAILLAYKKENKPAEFAACARREAIRMRDEIRNAVNNL